MKLKSGFVLEKVGGSYLAVAVGERAEDFRVLIKLNESGAFLWENIAACDITEGELTDKLVERYKIDRTLAARDVARFVKTISYNELLDE
jgi:hypothetical protein